MIVPSCYCFMFIWRLSVIRVRWQSLLATTLTGSNISRPEALVKWLPSTILCAQNSTQDMFRILWSSGANFRIYGSPTHLRNFSQINSVCFHLNSWRSVLILSCNLRVCYPGVLVFSSSPTKTLYELFLSPCVLHAPLIFIWSPE
jgi:hypothetical protein